MLLARLIDGVVSRRTFSQTLARYLLLISLVTFGWGCHDLQQRLGRPQGPVGKRAHPFGRFRDFARFRDYALGSSAPYPATSSTPLECFQVTEPVLGPNGAVLQPWTNAGSSIELAGEPSCAQLLMEHDFANSYGSPYVGEYEPPSCDFNRVLLNFTVEVKGRQFDRTAFMYLGDTEIWRTTTAEPTPFGIRWTYLKDVTEYISLWREPQTLIFELDNIVSDVYTGILNTTLTATFFKTNVLKDDPPPADQIIPISTHEGSSGVASYFTLPDQNATNTVDFPRNVNRAVFTVAVKGQADEEFFWSNVPQSAIDTFDATQGQLPGYGPWREFQIYIDGRLAGVHWPYPVIFTGGVVPQLNRPIVGIDTFDLREHEIDITPWLPLLCDGAEHTFTIEVVGLDDNGVNKATLSSTVDSSWWVSGKIFLWLDDEDAKTSGEMQNISEPYPSITFSQSVMKNSTGANETLDFQVAVSREFSVASHVVTQHKTGTATWSQKLSYSNTGTVYGYGSNELNSFQSTGRDTAQSIDVTYATGYNYPLWCNSTYNQTEDGSVYLWAVLDQGLVLEVERSSLFPSGLEAFAAIPETSNIDFRASVIDTWRNGTANYSLPAGAEYSSGIGDTTQIFYFGGLMEPDDSYSSGKQLYYRDVRAYNDTVTHDHQVVVDHVVSGSSH